MPTDEIQLLKAKVEKLERNVEIIAKLISRYEFSDPRIGENDIGILDRLDTLERRVDEPGRS
jgi:tetrahydromethanopterin S-methyltransferase subunit G